MNASLAHSYRVLTAEQDVTRTLEAVQVEAGLNVLCGKELKSSNLLNHKCSNFKSIRNKAFNSQGAWPLSDSVGRHYSS